MSTDPSLGEALRRGTAGPRKMRPRRPQGALPQPRHLDERSTEASWTPAANGNALDLQVSRLRSFVARDPGHAQVDVGFSLVGNGSRLSRRAVFVANHERVLIMGDAAVEGSLTVSFSGHGSQRLGSAHGLYERFPVFARTFEEVLAQVDGRLAGSMRDALSCDDLELTWSFAAGLPSRGRLHSRSSRPLPLT